MHLLRYGEKRDGDPASDLPGVPVPAYRRQEERERIARERLALEERRVALQEQLIAEEAAIAKEGLTRIQQHIEQARGWDVPSH